jgi:uncharacterized protein YuzE
MNNSKEKFNHYDLQSDIFYLGLKPGVEEEFREIAPGVHVELDNQGAIIGVEILNASHVFQPHFVRQGQTNAQATVAGKA